mmetsp:Transcript_879/g.1336  ORF Transcript_879/g.1336 Transcript_879/m.1336 type:complete len:287 (-) Transcript_879:304-1164(-)|eukprot:CAMPEP_0194221354 /NCGR_PEP_ID=MMETSP0156-20130528/30381_1 /TAXON_ID=33649 /ORGANISM="Thalassionema nitzschioides, Strain L26-B" /LENGTH=286 /DNA_ID=CAMNT_0038951723 /DNA_START=157 /DNA_END=1017 /DNA_ORIENTATION=+
MAKSERNKAECRYGQTFVDETKELLSSKLKELDQVLEKQKEDSKRCYTLAIKKCPQEVDEKFKLKHLRCEVFRVKDAARRIIKYWCKRVEIFGNTKAFLPMTLDGALRDDTASLNISIMRDTHCKDDGGRAILFYDPSRLPKKDKYDAFSMTRALWYTLHCCIEDEEVQRKGCVIIGHPKHAEKPDFTLEKLQVDCLRGCIPIRIGAIHLCHPPWFFELIWPVMRLIIGSLLRKRVKVHSGDDNELLTKLEIEYGISPETVPTDMAGGKLKLDHVSWLEDRRKAGL